MRKKMHKMMVGYKNKPMRKECVMQVSILTVTIRPPPPPPGFCTEMCAQPQAFAQQKMPGGMANK